jgi:hypothetical protein
MTRYQFVDINGITFDIDSSAIDNGLENNFYHNNDAFQSDIKIIEKTFRDGGVFSGNIRLKSKEIEFSCFVISQTDPNYRIQINRLLFWARKTILLKDLVNAIETTVLYDGSDIKYEDASELRAGKVTLTFKRLDPFWQTSANKTYNISGSTSSSSGTISITNNGYIDTQSIITIDAHELTTKILFHIPSTNEGIYIKDLQFGLTGLTQYIINNIDGTIKLMGNKRNNMIQQGSGWFNFPVGTFDLDYNLNGDCDISIIFKERSFI